MRPHCVELPVRGEPVRSNSPRQVGASHRSETGAAFCPSGSDHRAASPRFHAHAKTVRALAARLRWLISSLHGRCLCWREKTGYYNPSGRAMSNCLDPTSYDFSGGYYCG